MERLQCAGDVVNYPSASVVVRLCGASDRHIFVSVHKKIILDMQDRVIAQLKLRHKCNGRPEFFEFCDCVGDDQVGKIFDNIIQHA